MAEEPGKIQRSADNTQDDRSEWGKTGCGNVSEISAEKKGFPQIKLTAPSPY